MEENYDHIRDEDTQKDKYLIFSIGEGNYGLPIRYVIEIINILEITKVPEQPDHVKGLINLRGKILPVMDVRLRFKKPEREYDDRTCIVVIDVDGTSCGLIVDNVREVASIDEANISGTPPMGDEEASGFIEGVGKMGNEIWLLVDCKKLMSE